jgi:hypothetical protein
MECELLEALLKAFVVRGRGLLEYCPSHFMYVVGGTVWALSRARSMSCWTRCRGHSLYAVSVLLEALVVLSKGAVWAT